MMAYTMDGEREKIAAEPMRTDFIERIDHRNFWMGFGHDVDRAARQFEDQILNAGMTFEEAKQVLLQMHTKNMRMVKRAREQAAKEI